MLSILLIALSVHAQSSPTVLTPQLKNQIVKKTNCLPNAEAWRSTTGFVNDMLIDKKGIMWIATNSGLLRWDGNHKLVFNTDPKNPFQLQADKINAIFQRRDGAILLETQKANLQIEVLEKGSTQSKPITKDKEDNIVRGYLTDISISSEELIHAAFNEGNRLVIYEVVADYLLQKAIVQLDHLVDQRKIKIAFHEQTFWISVEDSGVWRVANKGVPQKVMDYDQKGQQLTYANFLISDQSNQLWLGLN
ncbi:MAG: two-component regulator propeller domain-containing protein [Saprospiraceae bacterium]